MRGRHVYTLKSTRDLATIYTQLNRSGEAEELQVQILKESKEILGAEHPHTLQSLQDLALTEIESTRQGRRTASASVESE